MARTTQIVQLAEHQTTGQEVVGSIFVTTTCSPANSGVVLVLTPRPIIWITNSFYFHNMVKMALNPKETEANLQRWTHIVVLG